MTREELINYWLTSAEHDFKTAENLFASGDFVWCLYIGHLVIEKLLKALFVKRIDKDVPRLHDLGRLADLAGLDVSEKRKNQLDTLTAFNISTRYPDYKLRLYKVADEKYTGSQIEKIKELRQWLLKQI